MSASHDSRQKLERLIGRVLREQPLRAAPRTLEMRVLSEIARRAASPWSRLHFMHWPLAGRAAFVALCLAMVKLTLVATSWGVAHVQVATRLVPPDWAIGLLLFGAAMYAALFALGAAAYRTLSIER